MSRRTPARTRLVTTAARLFRERGYHGVGLIEILAQAKAPKGSMYYAFPEGKADLALAAADHATIGLLAVITASFETAETWAEGLAAYCEALAGEFEAGATTCPVGPLLFDGPENEAFREKLDNVFGRWIRAIAYQAIRLDEDEETAEERAEELLIALQGAWILARARGRADAIRALAVRFSA